MNKQSPAKPSSLEDLKTQCPKESMPEYYRAYPFRVGRKGLHSLPYDAGTQQTLNWLFAYFQRQGLGIDETLAQVDRVDCDGPALYRMNESRVEELWNDRGELLFKELQSAPCGRVSMGPIKYEPPTVSFAFELTMHRWATCGLSCTSCATSRVSYALRQALSSFLEEASTAGEFGFGLGSSW